jgi:hypothetical protein
LFFPCDSSTLRYGFNLDSFGAFGAMKAPSSKPIPHRSATALRNATSTFILSYRSDMSSGACPIQNLIRPAGQRVRFQRWYFSISRRCCCPPYASRELVDVSSLLERIVQVALDHVRLR